MYYHKQNNHEDTLLVAFNYNWIELYKTYSKTTISKEAYLLHVIEMFSRVKEAQRGSWLILKSISTFLPFTAHLSTWGSRDKLAILIQSITICITYWCVQVKVRHWQGIVLDIVLYTIFGVDIVKLNLLASVLYCCK